MRWNSIALILLISATRVASEKDNVVKLQDFNFDGNVGNGVWFVKFFAPWCTHCQRIAPVWEELSDKMVAEDSSVKVAEVDCTVSKNVCTKVQIKAYPTLILIKDGRPKGKYEGQASVPLMEAWLTKQMGAQSESTDDAPVVDQPAQTAQHNKAASTGTSTSPFTAISAMVKNTLTRFPTQSKIINLYFYGFASLALLVAVLHWQFACVEALEAAEAAQEKTD